MDENKHLQLHNTEKSIQNTPLFVQQGSAFMSRTIRTLLFGMVVGCLIIASLPQGSASQPARRLLQPFSTRNSQLGTNTLRAQAATSQAIEEAVNSGGSFGNTRRAGIVGSNTAWAAGQNDRAVFSTVERWSGPWGR